MKVSIRDATMWYEGIHQGARGIASGKARVRVERLTGDRECKCSCRGRWVAIAGGRVGNGDWVGSAGCNICRSASELTSRPSRGGRCQCQFSWQGRSGGTRGEDAR